MFEFNIEHVKEDNLDIFLEMIPYVSSKIKATELKKNTIKIYCQSECNQEIIEELNRLYNIIDSIKDTKFKTVISEDFTKNMPLNEKAIFAELRDTKFVKKISDGAFSYSGLFLKVYRYFDRKINEYAYESFEKVIEEEYPVLFPIDEYVKGRYFENFPHYMMFQTKLNNSIDTYEKLVSKKSTQCCVDEILKETSLPKNVLRHATCAPVYFFLENNILFNNEIKCFLVSGKCFRNEELNIKELSRLNEFYMKEFVFIGSPSQIESYINKSKELVRFWINTFSLNAKCETASDSFFASNYKKLKYFQLIGNSKLEYKILVPSNKEYISCCSANYHRTHFSKPYNIKNENGEFCYTSCFAFGIERLAYTFLSQKGLDINKWDNNTIYEINKYVKI